MAPFRRPAPSTFGAGFSVALQVRPGPENQAPVTGA